MAKVFTHQPLDSVSLYGPFGHAFRYCNTESRIIFLVFGKMQAAEFAAYLVALPEDPPELGAC